MAFGDIINTFFLGYENDIYKMMIYVLGIVIYSIVVWKFYTNLSKRDLMKFNLHKFDNEGLGEKFFDLLSYFVKYLVITPILTFIWLLILLTFLVLLSKTQTMYNLLLISIILIAGTRIAAYLNERLAEELAKTVPIALLAIFVTDPGIFSLDIILERLNELPVFFPLLLRFFVIISLMEFCLRLLYGVKELFSGDNE